MSKNELKFEYSDLGYSKTLCIRLLEKIYEDGHCAMIRHGSRNHYVYTTISNKDIKKLIKYINKNYNYHLMRHDNPNRRITSVAVLTTKTYIEFENIFYQSEKYIKTGDEE